MLCFMWVLLLLYVVGLPRFAVIALLFALFLVDLCVACVWLLVLCCWFCLLVGWCLFIVNIDYYVDFRCCRV